MGFVRDFTQLKNELPIVVSIDDSPIWYAVAVAGIIFLVLIAFLIYQDSSQHLAFFDNPLEAYIGLAGLSFALIFFGLKLATSSEFISIDSDRISVCRSSIFRKVEFETKLNDYRGIKVHLFGYGLSGCVGTISLKHNINSTYDIKIFRDNINVEPFLRPRWTGWATEEEVEKMKYVINTKAKQLSELLKLPIIGGT